MLQYVNGSAVFSADCRYRYELQRRWSRDGPKVHVIGLNPSNAGGARDDPTVRRLVSLCRAPGYGGFVLTNLFGYPATTPAALGEQTDPIGPANDATIRRWSGLKPTSWHGALMVSSMTAQRTVWTLIAGWYRAGGQPGMGPASSLIPPRGSPAKDVRSHDGI